MPNESHEVLPCDRRAGLAPRHDGEALGPVDRPAVHRPPQGVEPDDADDEVGARREDRFVASRRLQREASRSVGFDEDEVPRPPQRRHPGRVDSPDLAGLVRLAGNEERDSGTGARVESLADSGIARARQLHLRPEDDAAHGTFGLTARIEEVGRRRDENRPASALQLAGEPEHRRRLASGSDERDDPRMRPAAAEGEPPARVTGRRASPAAPPAGPRGTRPRAAPRSSSPAMATASSSGVSAPISWPMGA